MSINHKNFFHHESPQQPVSKGAKDYGKMYKWLLTLTAVFTMAAWFFGWGSPKKRTNIHNGRDILKLKDVERLKKEQLMKPWILTSGYLPAKILSRHLSRLTAIYNYVSIQYSKQFNRLLSFCNLLDKAGIFTVLTINITKRIYCRHVKAVIFISTARIITDRNKLNLSSHVTV